MVSYAQYVKEAKFDIGSAASRQPSLLQPRSITQQPAPVQQTPTLAIPAFQTPQQTAPSATVPPAVTRVNAPTTTVGKNGQLTPQELTPVGKYAASPVGKKQWYGDTAMLSPRAAAAFLAAQQSYGKPIPINSAYRSLDHQAGISAKVKATPGRSKHGLGLALDIQPGTDAYNWLVQNGSKFGWHFAGIRNDPYHFEYRGAV